eukprot:scaffold4503_cov167-Amphora_coffeaeformis.AAC.14
MKVLFVFVFAASFHLASARFFGSFFGRFRHHQDRCPAGETMIDGECTPVTCESENACQEGEECVRHKCGLLRGRFGSPCKQFECNTNTELSSPEDITVPITCEAKDACEEGYKCLPARKFCITQPCQQFDCIPDDAAKPGLPEPIPMPPVEVCRENYDWDSEAQTCIPISCDAPDACLGGTCTADEGRQCITAPCQKFDCECPPTTHQYDPVTGHCAPLTCEAEDACTGEGETCQDVVQLCIDDSSRPRPCKQYFCDREGVEPEPACKPGYYFDDFKQDCVLEPERLPCKPGYIFDDFKQDCVPDSCKPCLAEGLACILSEEDCNGSCDVRCVENPCIFSICPAGSQCQVSTECEEDNLNGMQKSDVCAKCVPAIIAPPLPIDPCASTLCPEGTTCQVDWDCGDNLNGEDVCTKCVTQDGMVPPLCAATLCPEGTTCQVTQDCKGNLNGEEFCTECVPFQEGEPEPLSCKDPFACKPGYVCLEGVSDALDIWCYPNPCATIRCMAGHVCRVTSDVDCGSDTPFEGDCPPIQGECVPFDEEPPVPGETGTNDGDGPGEVDEVVSILCAQGFEFDTVTEICEPVSCEANPCGKEEECVYAEIRCVRAPCKQYECQPV